MTEVNQQLIAETLGLSRSTVSRCFTNHPGINPTTRAKVFKFASQIGYKHPEKRTMKVKRPVKMTFGVLVCTSEEEYLNRDYQNPSEMILTGVSERAFTHKAKIDVHLVNPSATSLSDPSYAPTETMRRKWAGLLLVYPFPAPILHELAPLMPMVSLVEQFYEASIDCVDVDHYRGIAAAVEHLVAQGHRRIGFFTRFYTVEATWSLRRYSAFMEKMARLELPVNERDVINVFPSPILDRTASIEAAIERTRDGVTAWVCAADHQGYDLIRGMRAAGFDTPRDVSVTGFDGIDTPEDCPTLSSAVMPFQEIGSSGIQRLVGRSENYSGSSQHILIDSSFRPGETTAPPRQTS